MNPAIFHFFHDLASQSSVLDATGIFLAKYLPYIMILIAALYILFKEEHWQFKIFSGIFIILSSLLARGVLVRIFQEFFQRSRPFETLNFEPLIRPVTEGSFPSGHAALLFGLAFAMFLFNKRWGGWFLGLALINGLARIFAGVHWPIDILVGTVIGFISFSIIYFLLKEPFRKIYKAEEVDSEPDLT